MDLHNLVKKEKEFYTAFMDYIEDDRSTDDDFSNLLNTIYSEIIKKGRSEFTKLLQLISMIAKNHHQKANFNEKIEKILLYFTKDIKQTFDNIEIFNIFKSNKRILYFLLKNKVIIINEYITQIILSKFSKKYPQYFFDEIRPLIHEEERRILEKEFSTYDNKFFNNYEENHLQGQNHSYLCNLIRNDSVEDFISYVNQMSSSILNSKIDHSIFESNSFLLKKNPSLIEYTAFFGSTQIFQYLKYNGVSIDPSLWLYAIHSGNPEMIHLLEDLHVEPYFGSYCECLIEAIKCHHNDIAYYIQSNLLDFNDSNSQIIGEKIVNCSIKYHNYSFFPDYLNNQYVFYSLFKYKFYDFVNVFLDVNKKDIESSLV